MSDTVTVMHEARITKALTLLGAARRERLDKADYEAFVLGLTEFKAEIVERVCDELGRIQPDEFQPKFPPLYVIRRECFKAKNYADEREREKRERLNPSPVFREKPIAPEKLANFRRDVEALLKRKVMP